MSHISWDTAEPTKTKSINGYHYTTVFVDHKSMYYWVCGHNSTTQIPELFDKFYADFAPGRLGPSMVLFSVYAVIERL